MSQIRSAFLLFVFSAVAFGEVTVVSWNLRHLGRTDQDLKRVAYILPRTDLIMLQEVNVTPSGLKALKILAAELSRVAARNYCPAISERPTESTERYAMLWNEDTLSYVGDDGTLVSRCPREPVTLHLGDRFSEKIVREPAVGVFKSKRNGMRFLAATVHVVPVGRRDGKKPQYEIPFVFESAEYVADETGNRVDAVIVGGDFNLQGEHEVFDDARDRGFRSVLSKKDKTSLKKESKEFSQAFDNIFFRKMRLRRGAIAPVFDKFPDLTVKEINDNISDHAPIKAELDFMN